MPDDISRERLRKKVLDRWENEGGKLSAAEGTKTPESDPPPLLKPRRKNNDPPLSHERPPESDDTPAPGKSKSGRK